ncbi:MAG: type II secretion system protein GspM [Candidatus Methylomirabilia bacterium]
MSRLSNREQVLVVLALLVAVLVGGYLYVVEPRWTEIKALEQDLIPAREAVLAKARARIAQREALRRQLREVSQAVAKSSKRFLDGATPPLAASELQKLVKEIARGAGVEVRSERILKAVERGGLLGVPLQVTVSGGIREIVTLLHRLQRTTTLLTLTDVKIRATRRGKGRGLLTTLTVSGFIRSETASGATKG